MSRIASAMLMAVALALPARALPADSLNLTLGELREEYKSTGSKFITLDGLPIHYVDEGSGPIVLLLHGSYLDLTSWNAWVSALRPSHRVIRVDRLRFGLTGTYPGEPVGYEQEQRMLDSLVAHLGIEWFSLVGASSGGIVAAQYADRHPDKVDRLILMNFPLGQGRIMPQTGPVTGQPKTPEQARALLQHNLVDKSLLTDSMVNRMAHINGRKDEGGKIAQAFGRAAALSEADRAQMLGRLKMPTLVMWSSENRTLPPSAGKAAYKAIGSRQKSFILVPGAGHLMPLEKGSESAEIARSFLTGKSR